MEITITPVEARLAKVLGKARVYFNNKAGKTNRQHYGDKSNEHNYILGAFGEIAMAKYANVYPDLDPTPRPPQEAAHDLAIKGKDGKMQTWDVKTGQANGKRQDLLIPERAKERIPDFYCKAILEKGAEKVTLFGWIPGREAIKDEYLTENQYGKCYRIPHQKLNDF